MRILDPSGIVFGVVLPGNDQPFWRDTLDVIATDPYPLYGPEPSGGYPLGQVADGTRQLRESLLDSRPFMSVIQYFQFTSKGRWPTLEDLRRMSYAAIVEGANGLWYWCLGELKTICHDSWCEQEVDYFNRLKAVITELKGLDSALSGLDEPELLAASNNSAIRTRVKRDRSAAYLIAFNNSSASQSVEFTWAQPLRQVSAPQEKRAVTPSGAAFRDTFAPYEAHVYLVE
jgi:hypothetical protein